MTITNVKMQSNLALAQIQIFLALSFDKTKTQFQSNVNVRFPLNLFDKDKFRWELDPEVTALNWETSC